MSKRRGNREGSIYQRKDGLWCASISEENGKRAVRYGKTRQEAGEQLRELQRLQDQGMPAVNAQTPLRNYLSRWLASVKGSLRPHTWVSYEGSLRNHVMPRLGLRKLGRLCPEHLDEAWQDMLKGGHSAYVIEHAQRRLSKALNDAVRRQLIYRNPCQAVRPPRPQRRELVPPDASALEAFLKVARETDYYEFFHTAFHSGCRRNELLALRWRDIDLDFATLSVSRSVYRAKGGQTIYQDTKTAKGRRLVALTPSSTRVLRALKQRQQADGPLLGYVVGEDSPIFRYPDGRPMLPRGVSGAFKRLVRKAGLPASIRLHDLRHAMATHMLKQGIHPKIVQERLGHSKISVTLDTYSHLSPGLQEAAALRFEESLAAQASTPKVPDSQNADGLLQNLLQKR